MNPAPKKETPYELLLRSFTKEAGLHSATLSGLRVKSAEGDDPLRRVDVKPMTLKGQSLFQFEYRFAKKVTHRNLPPQEAAAHTLELLTEMFTQATLRTTDTEYHLIGGKDSQWTVRRKTVAAPPPVHDSNDGDGHNRRKHYLLPEDEPVPFLIRLGVMTAEGKVIAARYDKFRQINRFLEMVADTLPALDTSKPLRVVDFGSGKSYLTFALYHLLHIQRGFDVQIVGLDLKADVIAFCNTVAQDLGYADRLQFMVGDIAGYGSSDTTDTRADMVVSLHACDTATDDALAKAVTWGASVILSVPCCQHELFRKINNDALRPLLKHGIFKERLASLVTDALRGEMLERQGYAVQVLEFIDMEHTPKNLLLRAVRRAVSDPATVHRAETAYQTFRDFWQIAPYIETVFPGTNHD